MREMNKQMSPLQPLLDLTLGALQHYRMCMTQSDAVAVMSVDGLPIG